MGGVAVWFGAEGMVRGAVKLAEHLGISSLVIGITVVALGTSAPELVVSSLAAIRGHTQIALGNVIGSNIINIGLVLGLSAVISPIAVRRETLRRDIPIVIAVTIGVVVMAWLGDQIGRVDGVVLLLVFAAYSVMSYRIAVREQERATAMPGWERPELKVRHVVFLVGGTLLLAAGAEGMVRGAVGVAEDLGISHRVIGMTIVAFGTSVPELAASLVAAKHGEGDLALGNVLGSNLYNALLILGTTALIAPVPSSLHASFLDFFFFVLFALMLVPMSWFGRRFGRGDGVVILVVYAVFNVLIVLH